jgi:HAD superfamily hydrolase (TIGR01509 family)
MKFKGILFDHDGVLADSEGAHMRAWKLMLEENQIPFEERFFRSAIGRTGPEILEMLLAVTRPDLELSTAQIVQWVDRKNEIYRAGINSGIRLLTYPGVKEGLERYRASGGKTAVVSNARRNELLAGLTATGLVSLFDIIFSRDDVPRPKPDPSAYQTAADALGIENEDVLAIDDSPTGLQSALLARIPCVSVLTTHSREHLEMPVPGRNELQPIEIFETMDDFFYWINHSQ